MQHAAMTISAAAGLFLAASAALADDLTPPSWRGDPGSTFQHWGFHAPGGGPPDAGVSNPYGTPLFSPNPNASWDPVDPSGQRTGVYFINFNWELAFEVPNDGQHGMQKELWLQYTFSTADGIGPGSSVLDTSTGNLFTLVSSTATDLGNGLRHKLDIYTYTDCPQRELVSLVPGSLNSPAWVDQVVIDTRCVVPGPGTAALLGAAGLLAAARRRRTNSPPREGAGPPRPARAG